MARLPFLTLSSGQRLTFLSAPNLVGYAEMCEMTALRDQRNFRGARKLYLVCISHDIRQLAKPRTPGYRVNRMQSSTVLVVDDFASFRECVCSILQGTQFRVVGQAADGLEAVQKARSCQPDIILLDIGLPNLNGMEVAGRVRTVAPAAKILFFSVDSDVDLVREALSVGAGYIHKSHAHSGLLPAMEAVLRGEQFVRKDLEFKGKRHAPRRHEVQFYSSDSVLLESFGHLLATALESGDAAIVLATKAHREGLVQRLKGEGFDVDVAMRQGTYISLDAADTLSTIMMNGVPDRAGFLSGLTGLIASGAKAAKKEHPRVAICGECVGLLCTLGNRNAAIRLEEVGNDLLKTHNVDIMCAYPLSSFPDGKHAQVFQNICAGHTAVFSQ
jgi:DNA-binding NarL/FixJ family response regulator